MRLNAILPLLWAPLALAALPYKGVDWSSLLVEEANGHTYKNSSGGVQPLETILKSAGVNIVRQRVWVDPKDGNYNLTYNVQLAKRAQAAGLQIYLVLFYSDGWADPGKQPKPAAWASLSNSALVTQVYNYTRDVMDTFAANDIPVALVSVGNEIRSGLLFPTGQLSATGGPKNAAMLLKSGSQAIKDSKLAVKPKIMLHLDNGWDASAQTWWYDTVLGAGGNLTAADYDVQGVSYYPFYNSAATMASLGSTLAKMVAKYAKEIMVVETAWPVSCPTPGHAFPSDVKSIPFSTDGQVTWMKAVAAKVTGLSGGKGTGLFYWEPAWIDNANQGTSCANNLVVSDSGVVSSALSVFKSL